MIKFIQNKTALKFFPILFLCLLICACGFKLRSLAQLPPQLHVLYLQTPNPYGEFETELKQSLRSSGITLVKSPQEAAITLSIANPTLTNTASTIGPSSQARVYAFTYSVSFQLLNSTGGVIGMPHTVSTSTSVTLSPNQLLQTNNQAATAQRGMERDLITQIYNILSSQQTSQALVRSTVPRDLPQ